MLNAILKLDTLGVPPLAREVAILTVGSHFRAAFELYSHEGQAQQEGITKPQIDAIKAGRQPEGMSEEGTLAYAVTTELLDKRGPLSKEKWDEALRVFGKSKTIGLLNYIGFYCNVAVLLNGTDTPVPKEANWKG